MVFKLRIETAQPGGPDSRRFSLTAPLALALAIGLCALAAQARAASYAEQEIKAAYLYNWLFSQIVLVAHVVSHS